MKSIPIRKIKEPNFSARFSIRNVTDLLAGSDMSQELHRHDFFYILALQKGAGHHEIDFTPYEVTDSVVFFMRPGQVHQLELKAGSSGFLIEFDAAFYHPNNNISNGRLSRASNKHFCALEATGFNKLHALLVYIFNEFTEKENGYIEVIQASLEIFFIEYIRQSRNLNVSSKEISSYSQERLEDFLALTGTHIKNIKKVSKYADLLNLSTYQLNAITKSTIGKPASALINEQIILEAKRYLLATPNQVKDIADLLGYEDVSYFIRFFKKHTGHSPEVFRNSFI